MRSKTYEAIVLRSTDVGEADRFCVLFTRESGRLAARARGVRKPGSRMSTLMPLSHVQVQIAAKEHPGTIQSVSDIGDGAMLADYRAFSRAQQGVEMVLALTEDDEAMPEVFDALLLFIAACRSPDRNPVPAFAVRLLHLLGILPLHDDDVRFSRLSDASKNILRSAAEMKDPLMVSGMGEVEVRTFLRAILTDVLPRPLKAEELQL